MSSLLRENCNFLEDFELPWMWLCQNNSLKWPDFVICTIFLISMHTIHAMDAVTLRTTCKKGYINFYLKSPKLIIILKNNKINNLD